MGSALVTLAKFLLGFVCAGSLGFGAIILLCFIVGELQRMGRKRAGKKREDLEDSLALAKAREEIRKRKIRLNKERLAIRRMRDDEPDIFEELRKKVSNDLE